MTEMTDFDPDEPPAYGQIWEYQSPDLTPSARHQPFMLLHRQEGDYWMVLWLKAFIVGPPMSGLHDDPSMRLSSYLRIA